MKKISIDFFCRSDVLAISKELLGLHLLTKIDGDVVTGGIIVETEAYAGPEDKASHAYNNRRTKRTEVMFHDGGVSYVYLCYGMYNLFNIVTNVDGVPHAVLIRAIQPTNGITEIMRRRNKNKLDNSVTGGPGVVAQALGITRQHTGISLNSDIIWLEDHSNGVNNNDIIASSRIGVGYAGDDALLPWRFRVKNNPWTSKAKH